MFGYFKRQKQKRERAVALRQLGEAAGTHLRSQLDLFIAVEIAPRRKAFLDVFRGQLGTLDERLAAPEAEGVSRLELAGLEYQILLENWSKRDDERLAQAENFLREQFEIADAIQGGADYLAAIQEALADQKLALMSDGLEVLMELVPESRADHDSAPPP